MSITVIIGPMFSGKTSELIRLIDRKRIAKKNCLIIRHADDKRFDHLSTTVSNEVQGNNILRHITTHNEFRYQKCDILYLSNLSGDDELFANICLKYHVVAIDEGFFFVGINKFCNELANNNVEVIVATLESSYQQRLFPEIGELIANAEIVIKLTAICMRCENEDASFTIRTIESDQEILVGSDDIYQAVCRKCLNEFKNKSKNINIESNKKSALKYYFHKNVKC